MKINYYWFYNIFTDVSNSSFVQFQIWDFPGQIDFLDSNFDSEAIFGCCGALIYVIDAQDDYTLALERLLFTLSKAYEANPNIRFEVFIHKVDGLSEDNKIETQGEIHQKTNQDLMHAKLDNINVCFYLTSIYDHSIFEAFSKVVQKLIPQLPTLENLLNIFISVSNLAFCKLLILQNMINCKYLFVFRYIELWYRQSFPIWCSVKDIYCHGQQCSRYAILWIMLRYDWCCDRCFLHLRV